LIAQLGPAELLNWRADPQRPKPVVIDVREPWEFALCRIEGAVSIPLGQLPGRLAEIPRDRPLVMVCHHGHRSQHAALYLRHAGFGQLSNLRGGVAEWAAEVEPTMMRY
jgi:rhodanese-related sulfurtransferase